MGLLLKTDRMEPDFGMEFCQTFGDRLFIAWGEAGDGESSFFFAVEQRACWCLIERGKGRRWRIVLGLDLERMPTLSTPPFIAPCRWSHL